VEAWKDSAPRRAAASEAAREQFRTLFKSVAESCDLPALPRVVARAIAVTRDPRARTLDVARIIGRDGALAARLLSLSGSLTYLRREPPRTLQDAVAAVGFETVGRMLVVAAARSLHVEGDQVAERLWNHALATALAADELAHVPGRPRGEQSFLAGLLHDVGKLVFHISDPSAFLSLGHADEGEEEVLYGFTHAVVGAVLVDRWGLERDIAYAIVDHHHHARASEPGLAARIARADWIAHRIEYGSVSEEIPPMAMAEDEAAELTAVADRVVRTLANERAFFA
jgi:putative nucleotidyltransferase with HDIG domain